MGWISRAKSTFDFDEGFSAISVIDEPSQKPASNIVMKVIRNSERDVMRSFLIRKISIIGGRPWKGKLAS